MTVRIIPRLDIKGPNLVKGIHLEGLRVLGKPERFAKAYYENGADELIYMDVVASLYQRNTILDVVSKTAEEVFIPLTVGGGIRNIEDIRMVLRSGADKVALNTAAIREPNLIKESSLQFGSSTIVVSIEATKMSNGSYECFTDNGRESTGLDAMEWAGIAAEMGAGELLITSIDQEGTGKGFDTDLILAISESVSIPVIACGGAGTLNHIKEAINIGKADAVCLGSMLHYGLAKEFSMIGERDDYAVEGNVEYLKSINVPSQNGVLRLEEIKEYLSIANIPCRV